MGADLHVRSYKKPDEQSEKMFQAYMACKAAGVEPPLEVEKFFDYEEPSAYGIPVCSAEAKQITGIEELNENGFSGHIIKVDELPPNIGTIIIGISY